MGTLQAESPILSDLHTIDHNCYELGSICLQLRRDLVFRRQVYGDQVCFVIEDPVRSMFHRIGPAEYTFVSLLDGQTSVAEAVSETASRAGECAFTETQAAAFCSWLVDSGLAQTKQSVNAARLIQAAETTAAGKRRERLNPLMVKVPLGNPEHLLQKLTPWMSWFFGPVGACLWCIVVVTGLIHLTMEWDQLSVAPALFSADNWIWLAATWLLLKTLHEAAHGVACQRFGGRSSDGGLLFLLFVPLPYIDVSTSWRFGSACKRIIVAAAGMYVEVFVAAVAMLIWVQVDSPAVRHHAVNVMITAGLTTLLFNLNPLMKFDGYHILCDVLQAPNLAVHGQQDLRFRANRLFFGVGERAPDWPEGHQLLIRTYGVAAFGWKIFVCLSLSLAAEQLFHGAGMIFAAAALVLWVVVPVIKLTKYVVLGDPVNPPQRLRFLTISVCGLLSVFAAWCWLPWVERLRLPAIVAYEPATVVRAGVSGFVQQVPVQAGGMVDPNDILMVLSNPDLESRIIQMELAIQQSRLASTGYHRRGELAALQVEQETEQALADRLEQLLHQQKQLTVRAPVGGQIVTRRVADLQGRWVSAGTELVSLGHRQDLSVEFLISQDELAAVTRHSTKSVSVVIAGDELSDRKGMVEAITPTATTTVKHPALAASFGGPVPVLTSGISEHENQSHSSDDELKSEGVMRGLKLPRPCFVGSVKLSPEQGSDLGIGQRGYVEVVSSHRTLGEHLTVKITQFFDERRQRLRE